MTERMEFEDGKYTVINHNGHLSALRYGEPWIYEISGSKLFYAMFVEALGLKDERDALRAELAALKQQEPVAWQFELKAGEYCFCSQKHAHANRSMLTPENHAVPLYLAPGTQGDSK